MMWLMMVSRPKLIKKGIQYTDKLFKQIEARINKGVRTSDTLESFITKTKDYTTSNPLVTTGYQDTMIELILQETNNHRFSRPSQKELARIVIEDKVGELITNVGDDIKQNVRDIVKHGYNNGLSQKKIADNISKKITTIKNTRANTIARTEIARTATISDYIINKERGATHFVVDCRDTCCDLCRKDYAHGSKEYSIEETSMLPPRHPNSYHKDTQVYTENGWKYIADLTGSEKLLSLNPDTDDLEFIRPVRLFKHKEPQLVHMHNKWFDVCVTPDHDCFIHQRRDGGKKGRYFEPQFRKPYELTSESRFLRCIDTDRENPSVININGLEFDPKDYAFFMAWYLSEGSVLHDPNTAKSHGYPIKISQQKERTRQLLKKELQRIGDYLGLKLTVGEHYFELYSKELYDYLLPIGYCHEMYIPNEIFKLNKECLNLFLDNYILGDGHERFNKLNSKERCIFTSSPKLKDGLSYIILLCGFCPSIWLHSKKGTEVEHHNGTYTQNYDVYGIRINSSKYANYRALSVDIIDYNDYVYCVELPKWHTLWVMRNGKTSWNGNCRCYARFYRKGGLSEKTVNNNTVRRRQQLGLISPNSRGILRNIFAPLKPEKDYSESKKRFSLISKDQFKKRIKGFVDSSDEGVIANLVSVFRKEVPNVNVEFGATFLFDSIVGFSSFSNFTKIPLWIQEIGSEEELLVLIHNHGYDLSNFPSHDDLESYALYGVKYGITTTNFGTIIVKNTEQQLNKENATEIKDKIFNIRKNMIKEFERKFKKEFDENNMEHNKEISQMINDNRKRYLRQYQEVLNDYDMTITFITEQV